MGKTIVLPLLVMGLLLSAPAFSSAAPGSEKGSQSTSKASKKKKAGKKDDAPKKASKKAGKQSGQTGSTSSKQAGVSKKTGAATKTGGQSASTPAVPAPSVPEPKKPDDTGKLKVTGKVVYGQEAGATRVAIVDVQKVFAEIPAYKKIKQERLKNTKARYHFLLSEANQKFQGAVEMVALMEIYDLVVEKGGVSGGGNVTDITAKVIGQVKQ